MKWSFVLILTVTASNALALDNQQSICLTKQTCSECIQEDCVWCSQMPNAAESYDSMFLQMGLRRCHAPSEIYPFQCAPQHVINPRPEKTYVKVMDNAAIQPQHVKVTVRKGQAFDVEFTYTQQPNYAVDLYYLMDLSASMADDKDQLSVLGYRLADVMKNLTTNFRLGFGSFVDKTELPFVSTVPAMLAKPCMLKGQPCAPPYSYKNHMSLTENTHQFTTEVQRARVSGNLDESEGGFDGLMQAIVCEKQIGWRAKARHLLVFATDVGFHYAGDGKLAGIVEPNDMKCHLNGKGEYTKSLQFDYPSISQINRAARRHNVNVIFAIAGKQASLYRELKELIHGSEMGILSRNSSNVVDLVTGVYDKLVDTLEIVDNSTDDIKIRYFSSCLSDVQKETNKCEGLRVGSTVKFTAKITASFCNGSSTASKRIAIKPTALNEPLILDVDVICSCDCERDSSLLEGSKHCNWKGSSSCGMCQCLPGYFGAFCQCDAHDNRTWTDVKSGCGPLHSQEICSSRGTCKCNKCECSQRRNAQERYYGKFCECDNFTCRRYNGLLCSGPGHGTCDCGQCKCLPDWTGVACECATSNRTCMRNNDETVCSGRGECVCGGCQCQKEPLRFSGEYCEECSNCPGQRCDEFRDCVECLTFQSTCPSDCSRIKNELVDQIEVPSEDDIEKEEWKVCRTRDDSGCTLIFKYQYDAVSREQKIYTQRFKECPHRVNVLSVALYTIGTIVSIGVASIAIWKVSTEVHDRQEYAKFVNETQLAKWNDNENPLYKQATTTFRNPMYSAAEI